MKLLFRLSLTILSLILLLTAAYYLLPSLLIGIARYQLTQQGFSDIKIELGDLNLQSVKVVRLQMSKDDSLFDVKGLRADYQWPKLLSGTINSAHIEQLNINKLASGLQVFSLPGPLLLSGFLTSAFNQTMPVQSLDIKKFELYGDDGALILSAEGEIHQQGKGVVGEIIMVDTHNENHLLIIEMVPQTGIDFQLHSQHADWSRPLTAKFNMTDDKSGISSHINFDLSQLPSLLKTPEKLSGMLQADITYLTDPGDNKPHFSIAARIKDAVYADLQMNTITANLNGTINQQPNGFQLTFAESSQVQMQQLKQGNNTLAKALLRLPRSLEIVEGGVQISNEQGAAIKLSNLVVDTLRIPKAELNKIAFSHFGGNLTTKRCQFEMQLTTKLVESGDVRLKPSLVQLAGTCPERFQMKWSIKASLDNVTYEDANFVLPLYACLLTLGNTEQDRLFDKNPDELGGAFSCQSSLISEKFMTNFRLNPITGVGSARFNVADIFPSNQTPLISSVLKDWQQPFDIVSGSLQVQGQYRWWKSRSGQGREKLIMDLDLRDAGGHYAGILFSGLNYQDSIEVLPRMDSLQFSSVNLDHIDIGIPISKASADIRIKATGSQLALLTIKDLELLLLDGKVKADDLNIDLNADEQNLPIKLEGLDLTQIIKLQQLDGLTVTGRLDGTLPVTMTSKGLEITQGKLITQQPGGRIQYQPTAGTANIEESAPGSALVFRVLEDLNYDSLVIDVNYAENGELDMQLTIKGKNTKVEAQRPIHFNLNLQQNVLKLLRALRYTKGINDEIDKNVQKYFQNKQN